MEICSSPHGQHITSILPRYYDVYSYNLQLLFFSLICCFFFFSNMMHGARWERITLIEMNGLDTSFLLQRCYHQRLESRTPLIDRQSGIIVPWLMVIVKAIVIRRERPRSAFSLWCELFCWASLWRASYPYSWQRAPSSRFFEEVIISLRWWCTCLLKEVIIRYRSRARLFKVLLSAQCHSVM